jgi:hypothetical protein
MILRLEDRLTPPPVTRQASLLLAMLHSIVCFFTELLIKLVGWLVRCSSQLAIDQSNYVITTIRVSDSLSLSLSLSRSRSRCVLFDTN